MTKHYHYAIYQPYGILGSPTDELHRFGSPVERDEWVNEDVIHRKTVFRTQAKGRVGACEAYRAFNYVERDQVWRGEGDHEVFVGVTDGSRPTCGSRPYGARRDELRPTIPVRGDGNVVTATANAGGESVEVTWVTTPNDTAIIVAGQVALVFEGRLDGNEFVGYVRTLVADSRYDRLIERERWQELYGSIEVRESRMALVA